MVSRFTLTISAVVAVGLLTSCGDATASRSIKAGAAPSSPIPSEKAVVRNIVLNALDDPSSPKRITYDAGLLSDPLPASSPEVKVTKEQASKISAADPFGDQLQPGAPVIVLRQITMGEAEEAKTFPGWVLVWAGAAPRYHGKPGESEDEINAEKASLKCVFVYVVNANSGEAVDATEVCLPKA